MTVKNKLLIITFIIVAGLKLSAQTGLENLDSLAGSFIKDLRANSKEKLFVQTNKWFYVAGEEIWLKAWIVNSLSHKYYSRSKTLFAELVDEKDTAIAQLLLNIPQQQTEGYIALPATLPEGYYWLRIYTANMIKHDTNSVFIVPLYVMNNRFPSKLTAEPAINQPNAGGNEPPQVVFYPEGGAMISGTTTMMGIRATGKTGKPLALEGYITDNWDGKDNIVSNFKSNSDGLGACSLYVYKSHPYIAHVKWNNQLLNWPLPAISQYASQLSLKEQNANNIKLIVSLGDSLYKKGKTSYLLGISRDSLCFASAGNDMYEVNVSKKNFPAGPAKFILFNDRMEVVSERAIYISKPDGEVIIRTDKENYAARDKVSLTILTADSLIRPSLSALSISVTDDSLVQEPVQVPVINMDTSDLWMLTEAQHFAGKSYYNNVTDINTKLTWSDPDSTITDISGNVINRKGQPVANRIVTLYANKQINLFETDTTDNNGVFKFSMPAFSDSTAFTLQVSNLKGVKVDDKIVVDTKSPFPKFSTPQSMKKKLSLPQTEQLQTFRSTHLDNMILGTGKEWLKEVIVKGKRKETSYNTDKRVSKFSYVLTGEKIKDISPNNAGDALLTVPGLHLKAGKLSLGGFTSYSGFQEPLLVVDGIVQPETPPDPGNLTEGSPVMKAIDAIPPDIIDFVEVLKGPEAAYYGARASNGVIIINTHPKYNYGRKTESYGTLQFHPKSYFLAPLFNMPDYKDRSLKNAAFKDFRSTLYWNGHVYSNPSGKATVEFFTADVPTTYTITVTGVTAGGDLIYKKAKINRR